MPKQGVIKSKRSVQNDGVITGYSGQVQDINDLSTNGLYRFENQPNLGNVSAVDKPTSNLTSSDVNVTFDGSSTPNGNVATNVEPSVSYP